MNNTNRQSGFGLIEIMVGIALFSILAAIAMPNLKNWMDVYKIKGAARELFSDMQRAKIGAIKENRQWKINFLIGGSYNVLKCLTITCEAGAEHIDFNISRSMNFNVDYDDEVKFNNPEGGGAFDTNPLIFNPNGMTNLGFIHISDKKNLKYYRIGLASFSGSIVIQQWNGTIWE
jgi:type IV fimbrial biogenesis protein FimT